MQCFNCLDCIAQSIICVELHQLYLLCLCGVLFSTLYSLPPLAKPPLKSVCDTLQQEVLNRTLEW